MKVLVVLSAVLALCAGTPSYLSSLALLARGIADPGLFAAPAVVRTTPPGGPANIVIGPGGVPLDTPEVAAAKAAHAVAVAETRARDAIVNAAPAVVATAARAALAARTPASTVLAAHSLLHPALRYAAASPDALAAAATPAALAAAPAVIAARTQASTVLAAHGLLDPALRYAAASPATLAAAAAAPAVVRTIPPGGPANIVIGPGGVPLDTPEVAAAKASHAAAVAETRARDAVVNAAPGVVAAAAPAALAAAHAFIAARTPASTVLAAHGLLHPALRYAAASQALNYAPFAPAAIGYATAPGLVAHAPIHPGLAAYGPANIVIGPGGVPLDTPEVAAGKIANAIFHLEAKARNGFLLG